MAESLSQTPAPKKDRIVGSKVNPKGSASSEKSAEQIKLSPKIIIALTSKLNAFKKKHKNENITLNDLKAVYRRGLGAYSTSHRPNITRSGWAMGRVNAFLSKAGGGEHKKAYVQDDDLMKYENGGEVGQEIKCRRCGWNWNTKDSEEFDKYVCHNCGFDNRTFYDVDPIGYADGGLLAQQGTFYTKDKNKKLEYYKKGNDYAFKVYDVENNTNEYEAIMNYNQFINYLYSELYIDDKYADGGEVDDKKKIYAKWKSLVNMSYGEIKKFYDSKEGKEAGLSSSEANKQGISSGRESARWLMKMKTTPKDKWKDEMWKWANKQISFISRMSGMQGELYDDKGNKTRKHTSLLIWGHNPKKNTSMKYENGGATKGFKYSKTFSGITIYTNIEQTYVGNNYSPFESKGSFQANVRRMDLPNIVIESKELERFNFKWGVDDWNTISKKLQQNNITELELFTVGDFVKTYELKPLNNNKMSNGGATDFGKVITSSSRFKPRETIVFDPPLIGTNGNKLISYTWSYEWTEDFNKFKGETVSKRISDWTQAETNAETGRQIVHQYGIQLADGTYKTVSSETVPIVLGFLDKKQSSTLPNLVTASKTLAKQKMQLAILEAKKIEEENAIKEIMSKPFPPITKSIAFGDSIRYTMGKVSVIDHNIDIDSEISKERKETLIDAYVREQLKEIGINANDYYKTYELKNRIQRQERKIQNILENKMEDGGELEGLNQSEIDTNVHNESTNNYQKSNEMQTELNLMGNKKNVYLHDNNNTMSENTLFKQGGDLKYDSANVKEYFAHGSGNAGGVLVGKRHSEGGIKAVNKSTGQPLEMEGGEVVITRKAVSDDKKREFEGEMLTNKEILSRINESGGGVKIFSEGGDIENGTCSCSGKSYKYGGKMMVDYDIAKHISNIDREPLEQNHHNSLKNSFFPTKQELNIVETNDVVIAEMGNNDKHEMFLIKASELNYPEGLPILEVGTIVYSVESNGTMNEWEIEYFTEDSVILSHKPKHKLHHNFENKIISFYELKEMFKNGHIQIKGVNNERELGLVLELLKAKINTTTNFKDGGLVFTEYEKEDEEVIEKQFGNKKI
jgi:hypothetical protein